MPSEHVRVRRFLLPIAELLSTIVSRAGSLFDGQAQSDAQAAPIEKMICAEGMAFASRNDYHDGSTTSPAYCTLVR